MLFFCVLMLKQPWFTVFSRFLKSKSLASGEIDHNINFLMLFYLFENLEQFILSLLCMSKAEVICRLSQSGLYALKCVFNNTAFQQWCQHHLTVPFLSFRKHPSCVCQEFDTSLAWVGKTYGCSIIWNMRDAWEQSSSSFHCYCGGPMLGVQSPTW